MVRVIVIKTDSYGFAACERAFPAAGLEEGRDFYLVASFQEAQKKIMVGEPQLLVTGSGSGLFELADEFVVEMKVKNPQLIAWFFSVLGRSDGPYERFIQNRGGGELSELAEDIKKFLAR